MTDSHRRGFTFIELLAALCAVSLLLVTMLPAMQQARMTAQQTACKNNLKQLGLALHNYHDVYRTFAPGWISRRQQGEGDPATGWQACILPYVDQAPLYNALELRMPVYENKNPELLKTNLTIYRCPTAALAATNPLRGGWGTSNYSGNYGATPIARWSESDFWPGQVPPATLETEPPPNGIFYVNSSTQIRHITDGTSNTVMVGERSVTGRGGIWPGPRSNFHEWDVVTDGSHASALNGVNGFSSRHPEGSNNILMCDGAVRAVAENLDSNPELGTLQKLTARNDGQPVNAF